MTSPHISNIDRAARANHALNAYIEVADCLDEPEVICDLLADLGHLCDTDGFDFQALVASHPCGAATAAIRATLRGRRLALLAVSLQHHRKSTAHTPCAHNR